MNLYKSFVGIKKFVLLARKLQVKQPFSDLVETLRVFVGRAPVFKFTLVYEKSGKRQNFLNFLQEKLVI